MSLRPETSFYEQLRDHKALPGDFSRVENSVDNGTPDITAAYAGIDYWVELKYCHSNTTALNPARNTLRKEQLVWHLRREPNGTIIFVLTKTSESILLHHFVAGVYKLVYSQRKAKGFDWQMLKMNMECIIKDIKKKRGF